MIAPPAMIRGVTVLLLLVGVLAAATPAFERGFRALIPDGRVVEPAGHVSFVGNFPAASALSPDGRYLAVADQDYYAPAIEIVAAQRFEDAVIQHIDQPTLFGGLMWTPDGELLASTGFDGKVLVFKLNPDAHAKQPLVFERAITIGGMVAGLTYDAQAHTLYAARPIPGDIVAVNADTGALLWKRAATGQAYDVALVGDAIVASIWDGTEVDVWHADGSRSVVPVGQHPSKLLALGSSVYVSDSDGTDVEEIDPQRARVVRSIDLALTKGELPGATPLGLALSRDQKTLFVTEAGRNDVAAVNLARGAVVARIPTGWYPTTVADAPPFADGSKLDQPESIFIASAKGLGSGPNPTGGYGGSYGGVLQRVSITGVELNRWRKPRAEAVPVAHIGSGSYGIHHVIFIVRENKTYDQEFGDLPHTNGDPTLTLYGRYYTPNAHALAQRYAVFDNFFSNAEVCADGHAWTSSALANDYLQRSLRTKTSAAGEGAIPGAIEIHPSSKSVPGDPLSYAKGPSDYPAGSYDNPNPTIPPKGQIFDEAARRGITFRDYGEQLRVLRDGRVDPLIAGHIDSQYVDDMLHVTDTERAAEFLRDVKARGLPQFTYMTLGGDHTAYNSPGYYTPQSFVTNNDVALGNIVAGLSKSKYWNDTIIFVTEDDPQSGSDHVDAHRLPALAIGAMVRPGTVSHRLYSQVSILRTAELLLGMHPLTIYDRSAAPIDDIFMRGRQLNAYRTIPSNVALTRNPGQASSVGFMMDDESSDVQERLQWMQVRGAVAYDKLEKRKKALGVKSYDNGPSSVAVSVP
jgi:DNA-binding beta-propeller fold protein YncE